MFEAVKGKRYYKILNRLDPAFLALWCLLWCYLLVTSYFVFHSNADMVLVKTIARASTSTSCFSTLKHLIDETRDKAIASQSVLSSNSPNLPTKSNYLNKTAATKSFVTIQLWEEHSFVRLDGLCPSSSWIEIRLNSNNM